MLNQHKNWRIKILRAIFASIHLVLISSALVSCVIQAPSPLERTSPQKEQNNSQPQQDNDQDDDKDDDKDDKNDDDKN